MLGGMHQSTQPTKTHTHKIHNPQKKIQRMPLPARLFIKSMLARNPSDRLMNSDFDYSVIRKHPFFSKFDWRALEERQLPTPALTAV
jgi:hypothetical protein